MAAPRRRLRRAALWICTATGGAWVGVGALILLQLRWVEFVRDEISQLEPLELWLGEVLFHWRPLDEKLAMAVAEIPEGSLEHAERVSLGLVFAGLVVAVAGPWLLRRRWRR